MKKVFMAIITIIIAVAISGAVLYINVFSDNAKKNIEKEEALLNKTENENQEEVDEVENTIKQIEEKVNKEIEEKQGMTEDEIKEAILFIESNIELPEDMLTKENIEKIAYYGAYLKNIVDYSEEEIKNEISILGEVTLEYSKEALNYINKNSQESTVEITNEEEANKEEKNEVINEENNENETIDENNIKEETNVITVNTSTALENAKTKVKESLIKINNNKNNLIIEFKEKIEKQYTTPEETQTEELQEEND